MGVGRSVSVQGVTSGGLKLQIQYNIGKILSGCSSCGLLRGRAHAVDYVTESDLSTFGSCPMPYYIYIYIYKVCEEECTQFRENVPYVKVCRYNPKPKSKVERLRR
jgi:hypothetical protein